MSTVTPNLGLVLPSNSEKVSRVIINTNNERIDAAFGTAGAKVYTVELAVSNVSGAYEGRVDDDVITAQMSANRLYIVDPTVFNDVITVTCHDGYLTLSCDDVAGDTTVEITVIKEAVDPTQITSTEFDILNNRIGDLSTLDTTNKSNVVNAVNEVKAGVDTNSDAIANLISVMTANIEFDANGIGHLVPRSGYRPIVAYVSNGRNIGISWSEGYSDWYLISNDYKSTTITVTVTWFKTSV